MYDIPSTTTACENVLNLVQYSPDLPKEERPNKGRRNVAEQKIRNETSILKPGSDTIYVNKEEGLRSL